MLLTTLVFVGCKNRYSGPNQIEIDRFKLLDDDLLVVVNVKKTNFTGFYPEKDSCPDGLYCTPPCFWFTHEAKILDILNGQLSGDKIKFSILQHVDNTEEIKKEWYVHLKKFENISTVNNLESDYYVENHNSEFSICY
jgi:hypothetical protein